MNKSEYIKYDGLGLAALIKNGDLKPSELVEIAITLIEDKNPSLNVVICKMYDNARKLAVTQLPKGSFTGVPFLIKDICADVAGFPSTMGSRLLKDYYPEKTSELVERYLSSGVIILGKTNVPEFGWIPSTESELFGDAHNPWDLSRTPGGSSGGSAAAVAARIVPIAHGNDGGGSLRIPASCCGVFSLKPSRGRMPAYIPGKSMMGLATDNVISISVRDSAAMLDATCTPQLGDAFKISPPNKPYLEQILCPPNELKIAMITDPFLPNIILEPEVKVALENTRNLCESLRHRVIETKIDIDKNELMRAFSILFLCGGSSFTKQFGNLFPKRKLENYLEPNNVLLMKLSDKFTAYDYVVANMIADKLHWQLERFFLEYDVILTPTMPHVPVKLGTTRLEARPSPSVRATSYTALLNITGHPAMSVPLHWHENKLPIGMQFVAKLGDEGLLLALAAQLEEASPWRDKIPGG